MFTSGEPYLGFHGGRQLLGANRGSGYDALGGVGTQPNVVRWPQRTLQLGPQGFVTRSEACPTNSVIDRFEASPGEFMSQSVPETEENT